LIERLGRVVLGLLNGRAQRTQQPPLPLGGLTRPDLVWAAATAGVSALLFATVMTSHPGLGDAPETVAGVTSLGVLHAPGPGPGAGSLRMFVTQAEAAEHLRANLRDGDLVVLKGSRRTDNLHRIVAQSGLR
jgi:hypothetical protein